MGFQKVWEDKAITGCTRVHNPTTRALELLCAELLDFVQRCAVMDNLTDDATEVYLFTTSEEMLNAVTRDRSGANLPLLRGAWDFQREIVLGVQEPFGAGIDPEPALRGMRSDG